MAGWVVCSAAQPALGSACPTARIASTSDAGGKWPIHNAAGWFTLFRTPLLYVFQRTGLSHFQAEVLLSTSILQ
jgi:hypothetical protein